MIHGGLDITTGNGQITAKHCCIMPSQPAVVNVDEDVLNHPSLYPLRDQNLRGEWHSDCASCKGNEDSGHTSFRTGMLNLLGDKPVDKLQRLDLHFDKSCNLACRICGPKWSTTWQKHLRDNNVEFKEQDNYQDVESIKKLLSNLDLSDLKQVVLCGGETLLGNSYWNVAEYIAQLIPEHAKQNVQLGMQTNGTQRITSRGKEIFERYNLVKLHVSIDAIEEQFEYLRWPAEWNQVKNNLQELNETVPTNTMFEIEETLCTFNLFYRDRLATWLRDNFSTNRLGDPVNYGSHQAFHSHAELAAMTREYYDALEDKSIVGNFIEQPQKVKEFIAKTVMYDSFRNQDWSKTFPEVYEFYARYV